jgi:hypothetical protein
MSTIVRLPGKGCAVMTKKFNVEPGHEVLLGGLWYKPGVMLFVEEDERVEIYAPGKRGRRGPCIGMYDYGCLNPKAPPFGLRTA